MSKNWQGGSTSAWRKTRRAVLDDNLLRNGGRCRLNYPGICTGEATQAHHVLGRAVTGDDPQYLQAVCGECNREVGDPTAGDPPAGPQLTQW